MRKARAVKPVINGDDEKAYKKRAQGSISQNLYQIFFGGLPKACGKFWQTAHIHIFCIWQIIICIHSSLESIFKVDRSLLCSTI
jgi:hypothetical protein